MWNGNGQACLTAMSSIEVHHRGHRYRADMSRASDLSIAVNFNSPSVQAFGAPPAQSGPLAVDNFVGSVTRGGSCNCSTHTLTPHCNGTHTECVGHITRDVMTINSIAPTSLIVAAVVSVTPTPVASTLSASDLVITRELLQQTFINHAHCSAIVIRTLPNDHKLNANYDTHFPAYFSEEALGWLASIGIDHLLVDLPSVDRMIDNGQLLAHRAFWGMPRGSTTLSQSTRPHATITELIYVPDSVQDGDYLLNLQVAPLMSDAAPSRPVLYPVINSGVTNIG